MHDRIGIMIDLEGASHLYKKDNSSYYFSAIDNLLANSTKICEQYLPEENNPLYAHQIGGDGILIISKFAFNDIELSYAIPIVIMQTLLLSGFVCSAGIAIGEFSDIQSCLPKLQEILNNNTGNIDCGGLITKFDVMGTALINSYRLISSNPKGSTLSIQPPLLQSNSRIISKKYSDESFIIDWIHSKPKNRNELFEILGTPTPKINDLQDKLKEYAGTYDNELWVKNTLEFNGI